MTTRLFAILGILLGLATLSTVAKGQTIESLPQLSTMLVHHYDCRVAILPAAGAGKELKFQFLPNVKGHASYDYTVANGADKVVASVNAQMLQVVWTRGIATIAAAQSMIQNSPTRSFVLIVTDPQNSATQTHLSCDGVMYADLKKANL